MSEITIPIKDPVVSNPRILGGLPTIAGTRIPASLVLDLKGRGYPDELIVSEYPSISKNKLTRFFKLIAESFHAQEKTI